MADTKVSALASLPAASLSATDLFLVVDVNDTSMAASGTDKNLTTNALAVGLGPLLNGPIVLLGFGWAGS